MSTPLMVTLPPSSEESSLSAVLRNESWTEGTERAMYRAAKRPITTRTAVNSMLLNILYTDLVADTCFLSRMFDMRETPCG